MEFKSFCSSKHILKKDKNIKSHKTINPLLNKDNNLSTRLKINKTNYGNKISFNSSHNR
jgi:hypothetical protein